MVIFEKQFGLVKYETNQNSITYSGKIRRCHVVLDSFLKIDLHKVKVFLYCKLHTELSIFLNLPVVFCFLLGISSSS